MNYAITGSAGSLDTPSKTAKRFNGTQQDFVNPRWLIRPKIYNLTAHLSIEKDHSP